MATQLFDLSGRVAVVTGGGTGLGNGMAVGLAQAGAQVVLASRRQEVVDRAAKKYAYHYRMDRCIYCAQCVVSCPQDALSMSSTAYHLASTDKAKFTEVYSARGSGVCAEEEPVK